MPEYFATAGRVGSSPRVRGKHARIERDPGGAGLIPARAGKTLTEARASFVTWAHPRACGENQVITTACAQLPGSSPRVRGKPGVGAGHAA